MLGAGAALLAGPAAAAGIAFDAAWQAFEFRRIPATRYAHDGARLEVVAERSSSVLWRVLPEALWGAGRARWRWEVAESVPATDIGLRGGEDRNLSLYFVFMARRDAARAAGDSLTRAMRRRSARAVIYVWGGARPRGAAVPSPYFDGRGTSVVLRPAGTGAHSEEVDLRADHALLFGAPPEALVAVAVSADSDDTGSVMRGAVEGLEIV